MKIEYAQIKEGIVSNSDKGAFSAKAYLGLEDGKIHYVMEEDNLAFEQLFGEEDLEHDGDADFILDESDFDIDLDIQIQTASSNSTNTTARDKLSEQQPQDINDENKYVLLPNIKELVNQNEIALSFAKKYMPDRFDTMRNFLRSSGGMVQFNNLVDSLNATAVWQEFRELAYRKVIQKWLEQYAFELV